MAGLEREIVSATFCKFSLHGVLRPWADCITTLDSCNSLGTDLQMAVQISSAPQPFQGFGSTLILAVAALSTLLTV